MRLGYVLGLCLLGASCGKQEEPSQTSNLKDGFVFEEHSAFLPTASSSMATAHVDSKRKQTRYPWPFALLSIGHTMGSYQDYGGDPYFHHGLDIRGNAGTAILASAGGKVVNIENYIPGNNAYWEIAILDDDGFVWQYHHVEKTSIPQAVHEAYRTKSRIAAGTKLGEVVFWSVVSFGERYHHIHLNILDADGNYLNPFNFLEPLADAKAPQILEIGLIKNGRALSGNEVSGSYSLFAKVHDLILHDLFAVPAYDVTYKIDDGEPQTFWRFDNLPGGSSINKFVDEFYFKPLTCGNYSCRRLVLDLGFRKTGVNGFPKTIGHHVLELTAKDDAGNATSKVFEYDVKAE